MLADLARQRTVVVVTHSLQLLSICRTIIRIERGQVAEIRAAEDLLPHIFGAQTQVAAE
jgi:ABC-type transport system involved in cytochrome bd biosynthesis fused ATPase/permease subunit